MHRSAVRSARYRLISCCAFGVLGAGAVAVASDPQANAPAGDPPFRISQEIVAAGGIDRARSACFELASTIAQPVTGSSSGGNFTLSVGFLDDLASRDSLFRSGFESCQP